MAQRSIVPLASSSKLQSDEIFRLLVNTVTDYAIFLLDPTGQIASWNAGAERLIGYKPQEIIGKNFSLFYTPAELVKGRPQHELEVATDTGRFEDEGWRVRKDGGRFWANVVLTRMVDATGHVIGFGKIIRDLSDRRLAELRYRLLVEGVHDYAIFSMDPAGHVTSWNLGAERLKGYSAQEIIGKHFSAFYTPEDRANGLPERVLDTASREGHFSGEGWRQRKDGRRFWASVVVTALRDDDGHLYGFSKVTRDMTERKNLLDALQRHSEELELRVQEREQSNAELEAFAYSVSHDLRAPLRAISGFADALREDYGGDMDVHAVDYLNEISSAAGRMNQLVQDLLDYGRVSRINIPLEPLDIQNVIDEAVRAFGAHPGQLKLDVPANLRVEGHAPLLVQVMQNLLTNAFKFQAPGNTPAVTVSAFARDGMVRVSVRDNGIGIAPQHQERIWQVFERLHDRETYPGTGIGLAIVKRAIIRMHGTAGVNSDLGQGAEFYFDLPAIA